MTIVVFIDAVLKGLRVPSQRCSPLDMYIPVVHHYVHATVYHVHAWVPPRVEGGGGGVTKGETIYTHVKYALKFKVSSIIFLQISVFLLTKC